MLLAWQLAKNMNVQPPPTAVVVPLTDDALQHPETLQVKFHDPTIDRPYLVPRPPTLVVVRFIGDAPEAHFTLQYLAPERRKVVTCVYTVTRRGPKPGTPTVTEEEIEQ